MNHPPPAPPAIFGVSDPRFTSSYPAAMMKGLGQAGVWVDYCKALSEGGKKYPSPGGPNGLVKAGKTDAKSTPKIRAFSSSSPSSDSVLLTLTGGPSCFPLTPQARQAYADYAAALVKANPNVKELQVWNEPEYRFTAQDYVPLLAATYDAIKGGSGGIHSSDIRGGGTRSSGGDNSAVPLILGPGAHPDEVVPPYRRDLHMSVEDFAREVAVEAKQRGRPVLDGYAYHPYWNWKPKITRSIARMLNRIWKGTPQTRPCLPEREQKRPHSGVRLGEVVTASYSRSGCLRFWWTETGAFSSGPQWGRPAMMLGLEGQAQRVYAVVHEAKCNPLVGGMFNYLLTDEQPTHSWTWQSGLYTVTGQPKPALWAFKAAQAARCGKARAVKR